MSIVSMSVQASVLIVIIVLARAIALNKLPKVGFLFLWGIAIIRMLIPFSISSKLSFYNAFSLFESSNSLTPQLETPAIEITGNINMVMPEPTQPINIFEQEMFWQQLLKLGWLFGIAVLSILFATLIVRSYRELRSSTPIAGNNFVEAWRSEVQLQRPLQILQSDRITTPIAVGIIRPRIILPKAICNDQSALKYILAHEYFHIRRFDMLWKLLALVAVCIHWFNPLAWVLLILFNRDLEITCDEMVLHHFGETERVSYAHTLIDMIEWKKSFSPIISCFSKNATEERIVAIMKYKKTAIWAVTGTILICSIVAICCLTNPAIQKDSFSSITGAPDFEWRDGIAFTNLSPGAEETSQSEIVIEDDNSTFLYSITYARTGLDLTYGLRAISGTEYSQETSGGYAWGVIENIPAGTYQLFVRNSSDYSDLNAPEDNSSSFDASGAINYHISKNE